MQLTVEYFDYDESEADILVTDGLHCGVEPIGGEIVSYLEEHPIDGVVTHRIYPEAVAAGKRFLSSGELGGKFDLEAFHRLPFEILDDDQKAALRFFVEKPEPYWLGIDPHTSKSRNSNSLVIGDTNVPAKIVGVAGVLGLRNVLVIPDYAFFESFSKFASIETEHAPGRNPLSDPQVWHDHIGTMSQMGATEMTRLGLEVVSDLSYYMQFELSRIDNAGNVDEKACALIRQLEIIEQPDEYFSRIEKLPNCLLQNIPEGREVLTGHWNDNNNSPEMPELFGYRKDGRPRRRVFGSFLLELAPPEVHFRD